MEIQWCCIGMKAHLRQSTERGFSVLCSKNEFGEIEFVLRYRAIDDGTILPVFDAPISLISEININYCPWCGQNLLKCYKKYIEKLCNQNL